MKQNQGHDKDHSNELQNAPRKQGAFATQTCKERGSEMIAKLCNSCNSKQTLL